VQSFADIRRVVAMIAVSLAAGACTGQTRESTNPLAASLIFENAYPDTREALTSSVDYRITPDNFARWQQAQENLDQLSESEIQSGRGSGGNAIDRAVSRLESNPLARQAIESAGLSVRDFVLETIALAQATESVETGKSTSPTPILADNYQFVRQYRSGNLLADRMESPPPQPTESPDLVEPPDMPDAPDPPDQPQPPELIAQFEPNDALELRTKMQLDAREREAAEARLQRRAVESARASQEESQRALDELQERVRRQIESALERYRDAQLREGRDAASDPWRELLGRSWDQSRKSMRQALLKSVRESRKYLRDARRQTAPDSFRFRR
jgi:hypothetical protein